MSPTSPPPSRRDVGAVIVAAGRGERFGGTLPKPFHTIHGVPMLLRALRPFAAHPAVLHVVLVVPPHQRHPLPEWLASLRSDRLRIVEGGATRAASVAAGLADLPAEVARVLVHDGARPFPAREVIDAVLEAVDRGMSAIAARPVTDTLKAVSTTATERLVTGTVDRAGLWQAQTPQGFPRAVLERAHRALDAADSATDDAQLVERLGLPVTVIPDSRLNLKITVPEDLEVAECIARGQG